MIEHIPELVEAGVDSFKIEGRMKTALYVAVVTRTYRQAIDDYFESPELYQSRMDYYKEEIAKCTYRQFTTGFFFGKPDKDTQIYDSNTYVKAYTYLGLIGEKRKRDFMLWNSGINFLSASVLKLMKPDGRDLNSDGESHDRRRGPADGKLSSSETEDFCGSGCGT